MGKQNHGGGDAQRSSPSSVPDAPEGAVPPPPSARPPAIRERLLRATVDVVSVVGYDATTVDRVAAAAGLGRGAFYRHLGGRHGALVGVCDQTLGTWRAAVRSALDAAPDLDPQRHAVVGLTALTETLAADPPGAAVFFLVGPVAGEAYQPLRTDLLALIATILGDPPGLPASSPAGAVLDVVHRRIARGHATDLPALVPALVGTLASLAP